MKTRKKMNKIGVSEMLSYIMLIAIAITVSIGVYAWIKFTLPTSFEEANCPDETSLVMYEYKCDITGIDITVKNNGRFSIDGMILTVSNDTQRTPEFFLMKKGDMSPTRKGKYIFLNQLKPGEEAVATYSNLIGPTTSLNKIESIQIQPFKIGKKNEVLCKNSVIKDTLQNCSLE